MGKSSTQPSRRRRREHNNKGGDDNSIKAKMSKTMEAENSNGAAEQVRLPLSVVVSNCIERWFQDTLKEAKAGDINMQVLVGQMYFTGYGVPRDDVKGEFWIARAARVRSSAWKVSEKRPGYNASDSDSDELDNDS
ncbi:hypothetical protein CASFOL_037753 [Castilleja foliolosa]|uniref:Uncharacterized protein n=1 Tax=Castilleja foliolosa TaxID=1961234 RepID=A0ABD3BKZ6_9LAMI